MRDSSTGLSAFIPDEEKIPRLERSMDIALSQVSSSTDISGADIRGRFQAKSNLILLDVRVLPFPCLKTEKNL